MEKRTKIFGIILVTGLLITACSGNGGNGDETLTASGTISAMSVNVASELGGKVSAVNFEEGGSVGAGDVLFEIDSEYIQSQLDQAAAAVETAKAALATAKVQAESANLQLEFAIQNSRIQFADVLADEQRQSQPSNFNLPVWYFTREEEIENAKALMELTAEELAKEENNLEDVLADIVNSEFIELEKELATAQAEYLVNDAALDTVSRATENAELKDIAQDKFDLSETKLDDVQKRYEQAVDTDEGEEVLEARASIGVAQATYDEAVDYWMSFFIGDDALQVQIAITSVELAEKNVEQAKAGLAQAQAAVTSVEIQLEKAAVIAPISGDIFAQNIEVGELIGAGGVVMTIGNIDEVNLTIYIPEDEYGRVSLDQDVKVFVDSFPEMTYMGTVTYISDAAEFTPSNVQTVEGRKSTVFAVEITIENDSHDLKPGMPADVNFIFD
ncbi:MAG: HlyD family efflux transporter periplasmic adaptor subunit [Chloroflexota bacterium]|nr:HlyD family efflux transporter periplasmic adaptor subunit [Chloroflexota bacterium]